MYECNCVCNYECIKIAKNYVQPIFSRWKFKKKLQKSDMNDKIIVITLGKSMI